MTLGLIKLRWHWPGNRGEGLTSCGDDILDRKVA